jgi:hypothetical protein
MRLEGELGLIESRRSTGVGLRASVVALRVHELVGIGRDRSTEEKVVARSPLVKGSRVILWSLLD